MHTIQSRPRLMEGASAAPTARPALPIRRAAAEEALRDGDGPVELTFDVVRAGGGTQTISMTFERPELERALDSAEGDELALVFDTDELARAIEEPDVEAQGMREKAAVLTVAVAAIAGTAGSASALSSGASGTGYVVPAGSSQAVVSDAGMVGASGTGYVVPAGGSQAVVDDAGMAGASGTGYVVPAGESQAVVDESGMAGASGTGYVVPAGGTEAIVDDGGAVAPVAGDDGGLSSTEGAAIGAGAILLVAGAAFAARPKRRPDKAGVAPA